ncbi:AXL1 [[Candida] subhashii]|uniref:AXL1 n=1 Tax=[Candida] subhashii TaxID=561895 RepID=A0A8J5QCP6_9ASCO|nr:AXL1 [[Candida] subhashii]KAG7663824.1 AXL1 [[Candida] subhashii]
MEYFQAKTVTTQFKRPLSDLNKLYKHIILKNGLSTLLVSDPSLKVAACSMCVKSGSHCDPDEVPGLAHFCEHMVFMGTAEYPAPNELLKCINALGGNGNAFTTGDRTCFFYEIPINKAEINNELGFNYSLKVFSTFFNSPLFNEAYMDMEINSVNHEHELNLVNNSKILYHGFRLLADKDHPFHRFATGTKETLKSSKYVKIKTEIVKYFQMNYYAENMTLVLKGPQSLNQLQKLAIANFSNIRQYDQLESKLMISSILPDRNQEIFKNTNKVLFIQQNQTSKVRLIIPIFGVSNKFFESVWCNLLGDESKGSVCHYLKEIKQYTLNMFVFTQELSYTNRVLVIDAKLTRKGESNLGLIIETIFEFINQLMAHDVETLTTVLREYSRIFKFNAYFRQNDSTPMDEASELSIDLHDRQKRIEDIVLGDAYHFAGDARNFKHATRYVFDIKKLNVIVVGTEPKSVQTITFPTMSNLKKDPYYQFSYQIFDLKFQLRNIFPSFSLLERNEYLHFTHEELDKYLEESIHNKSSFINAYIPQDSIPKLLDYSNYHEIWIAQTPKWPIRIITSFQICFASVECNPINAIGMEILTELMANELTPEFYHSELAMDSWALCPNYGMVPSLSVYVCGPKHGFRYFIEMFLQKIKIFLEEKIHTIGYKKFTGARLKLLDTYNTMERKDSIKQAIAISILMLEEGIVSLQDRIEALELIDADDIADLANKISEDTKKVKILISGNIDEEFALDISRSVNRITSHLKIYMQKIEFQDSNSIILRPGRNYTITQENPNEKDTSDVVYHYIQLGLRKDEKSRTIASFLSFLLSQAASFILRTKKQLGYIVLSGMRYNKQTLGVYICVSSGSFDYCEVMKEIENLLFEWELQLINMSQEEINKQIDSFIQALDEKEPDRIPANVLYAMPPARNSDNFSQGDEDYTHHQDFWEKILTKNHRFTGQKGNESIDRNMLRSTTTEEIVSFFRKYISIKSTEKSSLTIFISSQSGREHRKVEEAKETIQELLDEKGYTLTDIQITMLLKEYENNVNMAVKHLQKCGYKISVKHVGRVSKLITKLARGSQMDNTREIQKLQEKSVKKYGRIYQDSSLAVPYLEVRSKEEVQNEAILMH